MFWNGFGSSWLEPVLVCFGHPWNKTRACWELLRVGAGLFLLLHPAATAGGALGLHQSLKNNLNNNNFNRGQHTTVGDRHNPKPNRWPSVQILDWWTGWWEFWSTSGVGQHNLSCHYLTPCHPSVRDSKADEKWLIKPTNRICIKTFLDLRKWVQNYTAWTLNRCRWLFMLLLFSLLTWFQ